jgi:undecaprenyl-diphosphatase
MDSLIIFAAKYLILVPVVATAYLIYTTSKRRPLIKLLVCGGVLSLVLAKIASHLYWDPRPFLKDGVKPLFTASRDNGFPSDHTLLSAFLGFVALGYSKKLGWALLAIAVLIGWARLDAGDHHAVDIVASFVITAAACFITLRLLKIKTKPAHPRPEHKTS